MSDETKQLIEVLGRIESKLDQPSATGAIVGETAGLGKDIVKAIFKRSLNIVKALVN